MATKKQTKSRPTKKKTTRLTKAEQMKHYKIKYELKMIALFSVTLFAMISLYTKAVGVVGEWITGFVLGLFSYVGYLMPLLIFCIIFVNLNPNFKLAKKRVSISLAFITIGLILSSTLIVHASDAYFDLKNMDLSFDVNTFKSYYSSGQKLASGGIFGELLTRSSVKAIGSVGTLILIMGVFITGFVVFTRVSLQELYEAYKLKLKARREAKKLEAEALETLVTQETPVNRQKQKIKSQSQSPEFLTQLETLRKVKRKKEIEPFDYDSYEKQEAEPVASETISFFDHDQNKSVDQVDKPIEKPPVKLKNQDIDAKTTEQVTDEIQQNVQKTVAAYKMPSIELLKEVKTANRTDDKSEYIEMARLLEDTLGNFNVDAKVVSVKRGPSITMFEVQPSPGVKVSKIVGLSDDIALNLATSHVRIAPIPGKAAIGIEVPNKSTSMVTLREVISSPEFSKTSSKLSVGLGKDISGNPIIGDLSSMPHLLIAGATGSGKSVCVNTIISSILFNAKPDEVKFLMIDPKVVELSNYNGIPHLILPVVTDPKKASVALNWAVNEMTRRYKLFAEQVVRDMKSYNKKAEVLALEKLPQIVVIIDELADLMMVAPNQVEDAICRLAQMARAAGIHLIVATQRPSVDVITGLIKANIPSRIAFSVSSAIDSRTIIDMGGAEKLLGKGDMLYYPVGASKPKRAQGAFMSDEEVESLVNFIKNQSVEVEYNEEILDEVQNFTPSDEEVDDYLEDAIAFVVDSEQASASLLQRRFRVGYNRAARLIDSMEERGIVGPSRGSKPREVLVSKSELESASRVEVETDAQDE
ncbi:FtsK/SpoIIIE family DNA translocase [Fusibacter tunisiensis]|uniref:S-DNA-T family DNA segregation ATPase FtsK/SpoIIIE n=1 Tax=Fusibacter tunisiensis TaxID=1008308 RepID=A0ABS2MML6_9FIRM|nr:DNA translocase FtsK [Fusibacter tunisiensis]MBM7560638.1 S-DNA-T family DNA segregation ATPase FtsK/SpoIIIE [Fusibacter tunisiensis]